MRRAGPGRRDYHEPMHETSLAGGILKVVEDAAARDGFARVRRLQLQAGTLAGVEVAALRFALAAIAPGTLLDGAEVAIDEPPGRAWCPGCEVEVPLAARTDACPHCGGFGLRLTAGTELKVVDLLVDD